MQKLLLMFLAVLAAGLPSQAVSAQTLDATNFRIEWQVANRFRMFRDPAYFTLHANAWRQYLIHVDGLNLPADQRDAFVARTSVLGSEHVLNDRRIAFSNVLRKNFDWRGWAAKGQELLCYDAKKRNHSACGGIGSYLNPQGHAIELWVQQSSGTTRLE